MSKMLEKITDLNDLVLQGKAMEAFEKYYDENVSMQENESEPTVGKETNRKREEEFFSNVTEFRSAQPLKVTIGENTSMVEWQYDYTHKEWGCSKLFPSICSRMEERKNHKRKVLLQPFNNKLMKNRIFDTSESFAPLAIRIMLGVVVFPHGAQKLFGWFGGYGFSGTMGFFTDTMGLPWLIGLTVILLESIGAIALIAGLATRMIAVFYLLLALGTVFTSNIQHGFFMNWFGNQQGEGYEYFILWIGMAISLVVTGAGKYSIDGKFISENASA